MTVGGEKKMPARTPQQIFQHHAGALGAEDLEGVVADYSDDAFFMSPAGVLRGKAGTGRRLRSCSRKYPGPNGA
jgi:ketosteroid isomerase-like protein